MAPRGLKATLVMRMRLADMVRTDSHQLRPVRVADPTGAKTTPEIGGGVGERLGLGCATGRFDRAHSLGVWCRPAVRSRVRGWPGWVGSPSSPPSVPAVTDRAGLVSDGDQSGRPVIDAMLHTSKWINQNRAHDHARRCSLDWVGWGMYLAEVALLFFAVGTLPTGGH